jgi:signal transduction histidine kinase
VESATGGSGIGLSVVRELVAMQGGRARAESAPGGGARLVIEFPLSRADAGESPPAAPLDSNVQLKAVP